MADVGRWLDSKKWGAYRAKFEAEAIDGEVFAELSEADLEKFGVTVGGHRKLMLKAIALLKPAGTGTVVCPLCYAHADLC